MRVMAIDPSKWSTGIALYDKGVLKTLAIRPSKKLTDSEVLAEIGATIGVIAKEHGINLALIEDYAFGVRNSRSITALGEVQGVIKAALGVYFIPVISVSIPLWKSRTIGQIKKADKKAYLDAVEKKYSHRFTTTDEADAYMIYEAVKAIVSDARHLKDSEKKIKEQYRKAHEALHDRGDVLF